MDGAAGVRGCALGASRLALVIIALRSASASADDDVVWHASAELRNDAFSEARPPFDDVGFTHDNIAKLHRQHGELSLGGSILQRLITSSVDRRRWDQLDVVAVGERTWPYPLAASARIGPTFGGNLGGRYLQNGWHGLSGTGPTLGEGLADYYQGGREVAMLVGARVRSQLGDDTRHGYAHVDGQVALGPTGITSFEVAIGGRGTWRHVGAHVELALTGYHLRDPNLRMPGGYDPGIHFEWRAGVHVAWSRYEVRYQYRANEGGSGQPIGGLALTVRF